MTNALIGIALIVIPLVVFIWFVNHLSQSKRKKVRIKKEREAQYRLVLEQAKISERKERQQRAMAGHVPTLLSLAKECELTNARDAIKYYTMAALKNNEIAQRALIRLCREDVDDPLGRAKSSYWEAVVGARNGEIEKIHALGLCYLNGTGVEPNMEKAIEHITQAGEKGYMASQRYLGEWFNERDPARSFMWWLRAAINQDMAAQKRVAFCYQTGNGVEKDKRKAIYWIERAAEQGDVESQFLAGKLHLGGCANDAAVAYSWFSIACANGYATARQERDDVVPFVGIETLLRVQEVAKTVYNKLKEQPYPMFGAIEMLNRVYNRDSYFPNDEELSNLYSADVDHYVPETELLSAVVPDEEPVRSSDNLDRLLSEFSGQDMVKSNFADAQWQGSRDKVQ
ncbi:tetratricopeptide repeat protein [Thaumasiovibrio subtropicus]|uniref:tetratricopeptide repeat protein n=1 Tax=Thaumasiovibrio subtropicus TaxID=1891207 RepID=UPI000B3542C0|nr:tetratricopeptide repeat protein [Thaumasiovibrio subtropicus]